MGALVTITLFLTHPVTLQSLYLPDWKVNNLMLNRKMVRNLPIRALGKILKLPVICERVSVQNGPTWAKIV